MKLTSKKTIMFFKTKEEQKETENYLINLNVKFRSALKNKWVEVAPRNYKKHNLDLLLPNHLGISTYNYKLN